MTYNPFTTFYFAEHKSLNYRKNDEQSPSHYERPLILHRKISIESHFLFSTHSRKHGKLNNLLQKLFSEIKASEELTPSN